MGYPQYRLVIARILSDYIAATSYTCHKGIAVVACAKFCGDSVAEMSNTGNQILVRFAVRTSYYLTLSETRP